RLLSHATPIAHRLKEPPMTHTDTSGDDLLRAALSKYRAELVAIQQKISSIETLLGIEAETAKRPVTVSTARLPNGRFPARARPSTNPPAFVERLAREVKTMTQKGALVHIAQENNGTLHVAEAKNILLLSGLSNASPKNTTSHIYSLLGQMGQFE